MITAQDGSIEIIRLSHWDSNLKKKDSNMVLSYLTNKETILTIEVHKKLEEQATGAHKMERAVNGANIVKKKPV